MIKKIILEKLQEINHFKMIQILIILILKVMKILILPSKYIDRNNLRMLYDVLNVKATHGIDFQSFFELMKIASDDMEEDTSGNDDFVLLSVLDFFCVNFIRGFNKLILDLGFDSFENDFDN